MIIRQAENILEGEKNKKLAKPSNPRVHTGSLHLHHIHKAKLNERILEVISVVPSRFMRTNRFSDGIEISLQSALGQIRLFAFQSQLAL